MTDLIGGIYPKPKHANAPDYVIGKLSINVQQFREWMQGYLKENPDADWINMELKVGRSGRAYAALDTWKPTQGAAAAPEPAAPSGGDIPF